jgi:predicted metal-dependent peptidase
MKHPFIASAAMRLKWMPADDVPTLCVNGKEVLYNAEWFDKLDIDHQVFCMAHEAMHVLLLHCAMLPRWVDSGFGPDNEPFLPNIMNIAQDYLINGSLIKEGFKPPVLPGGGKVCHDVKYDLSYDLVRLYIELKEKGDGGGPNDSMDQHLPERGEPVMTPSEILSAAHSHRAMSGKDSKIVESVLMKVLPKDESPWAMLRSKLQRGGAPETSSWSRPNRHLISRGIVAPSPVSVASTPLAVVVDISGSCHAQIPEFLSHVASIVQDSRTERLILLFVDTRVQKQCLFDNMAEFEDACQRMEVPHGGDTDMTKGLDRVVEEAYNRVVVITDGYTPYGKNPNIDVIWAMTTDVKPPYGEVVRI